MDAESPIFTIYVFCIPRVLPMLPVPLWLLTSVVLDDLPMCPTSGDDLQRMGFFSFTQSFLQEVVPSP